MIEFFNKNYEWIFSGIGVLVITILLSLFRKEKSKSSSNSSVNKSNVIELKESNNNNVQIIGTQIQARYEIVDNDNKDSDFVNIVPINIMKQIQSAPLYQQKEIANHYIGLKIKWILTLFHIYKHETNIISVSMEFNVGQYPDINFIVDIEKYPILKTANAGKMFEITGKIIACETLHISIELENLKEKI